MAEALRNTHAHYPTTEPTLIGMYALLAEIGSDYRRKLISDTEYVTAAQMAGLTRQEAIDRCLRLDDDCRPSPALVQYRQARRMALRFCQSARYAKQCLDLRVGMDGLDRHQMALVKLRREYYGAMLSERAQSPKE
jgi:hypothetical protein